MASNPLALFLSRTTASPYAISLGVGLGSISYFFWGNLAGQATGAIVIPINPNERKKVGLDTSKAVEIWNWTYTRAAAHFGISSTAAFLAVLAAAVQIPEPIYSAGVRNYLLLISGTILSTGIYTMVMMLPINNRLVALNDLITRKRSEEDPSMSALTKSQADEAERLLKKWKMRHYWRVTLGGLGWLGTIAAYVTTI